MQRIKRYVDSIEAELKDAQDYAECYIKYRVKGNSNYANKYKEMANDELKHAGYLHEIVSTEIEEMKAVFTPNVDMQEKWDIAHKRYVDQAAYVKQMLTLQ